MTTGRVGVEHAVVLDEHRAIRAAMDALRTHVRLPSPSARPEWARRVAEDLGALAGLLRPHFAWEEATGMFEAIEAAQPEAGRECARLRVQHAALLERLGSIECKLQRRLDAKAVDGLRRGLGALLAGLARHEAAENALLVRAMEGEEVGAVD